MILTAEQISEKLSEMAGWELLNGQICKTYKLEDFNAAVKFVNQVGELAEKNQHHPDIDIRYNKVTLTLSTHSEKGLTEKDFNLAEEIDQLET